MMAYEDTAAPATLEAIVVGAKRNRFPLHFFLPWPFSLERSEDETFC